MKSLGMNMAAAVQRRSPASRDELDTHEQLLRDIAALEEVDNCSSLVLQELLQRKPSPSSPQLESTQSPLHQPLHLQQVNHHPSLQMSRSPHPHPHHPPTTSLHAQNLPHPTQMHDAQHFHPRTRYRQHPVRHVEVCPPFQSCHHQPADDNPVSLLHQVLECPTETGLMRSESPLDCLVMHSRAMTLPALSSEPIASKRTSASALRKTKSTSLRRAAEKSSTVSAEFSPPEQDTVGTSTLGKNPETPKGIPANHFLTERQRREFLNEKYQVLRSLIPNPTKADRASIVQDAIDYVNELKQCADKLRCDRGLADLKRRKVLDGGLGRGVDVGNTGSCKGKQPFSSMSKGGQEGNVCTLSHKMSRDGTEVEVRVFDDEATIKVTQHQSRRSLLLDVVWVLNDAELELLHANGARIGNCHAYMLNVKIHESRATLASQIARQLLERIDVSLEQTPSTRSSQV